MFTRDIPKDITFENKKMQYTRQRQNKRKTNNINGRQNGNVNKKTLVFKMEFYFDK